MVEQGGYMPGLSGQPPAATDAELTNLVQPDAPEKCLSLCILFSLIKF